MDDPGHVKTREEIETRIYLIDQELDKSDAWEYSPYRNSRRKLNREKERLLRRLRENPMGYVKVRFGQTRYKDLDAKQRKDYKLKKEVERLKKLAERKP